MGNADEGRQMRGVQATFTTKAVNPMARYKCWVDPDYTRNAPVMLKGPKKSRYSAPGGGLWSKM